MNNQYTPTGGMVHTATEGLRFVESGKVNPDGVKVEVPTYSTKLANGESLNIADVSGIVSHLLTNVTNRKKGWDEIENLSNERINWQLQGGCQAFEWSHKIVAQAISDGEITADSIPGYVTPEEFLSTGGCY